MVTTVTTDPATLLDSLDVRQLQIRLDDLDRQRRALAALLRVARERDRHARRRPPQKGGGDRAE